MNKSDFVKLGIGVFAAIAWLLLVIFKVPGADDIITAIKLTLAGLGCYHLNDRTNMPPPAAPAPVTTVFSKTQGGFASPLMLLFLVAVSVLLTGCASWIQAASAYNTYGMESARAAEDLNVKVWTENACATPLSTIQRHPEIAGGLKALCLSPSSGSASDLLPSVLAPAPATPGVPK